MRAIRANSVSAWRSYSHQTGIGTAHKEHPVMKKALSEGLDMAAGLVLFKNDLLDLLPEALALEAGRSMKSSISRRSGLLLLRLMLIAVFTILGRSSAAAQAATHETVTVAWGAIAAGGGTESIGGVTVTATGAESATAVAQAVSAILSGGSWTGVTATTSGLYMVSGLSGSTNVFTCSTTGVQADPQFFATNSNGVLPIDTVTTVGAAAQLVLTPAVGSLTVGTVGTAYGPLSFSTAYGTAPYTYTLTTGSLPTGLVFNNGVIAGAPTVAGTFNIAVKATDSNNLTVTQSYLLMVNPAQAVAALSNPIGVAIDGSGNLYIADYGLSYIVKVPAGCAAVSCEQAVGSGFSASKGIAVDGSGNVYVIMGGASGSMEEIPWNAGNSSFGAPVTLASGLNLNLGFPAGVAVDGAGNVYFTDSGSSRVLKLPWNGSGHGTQTTVFTGTVGSYPTGIAVDGSGNIYISDAPATHSLTKVAPNGVQTTLVSTSATPYSVAVDGSGNVYYSDGYTQAVIMLPWTGTAFAGSVKLGSGLTIPYGLTVDGSGNVYVVNDGTTSVVELALNLPPGLIFAATNVGSTSSSQTVTLENIGNADLSFPVPASGNNPSIATNFTLSSTGSTACPLLTSTASTVGSLAQGTSCTLPISFAPTAVGGISGSLVLTDNNLNQTSPPVYVTQTIPLSGTATDSIASFTITGLSNAAAGTPQTITVTAKDPLGNTYTGYIGTVHFTSTDGNAVLPANATLTNGTGTFTVTLKTAGSQSVTVTDTATVSATGTESATMSGTTAITWPVPAAITYGTVLSTMQLNATANVAGSFVYTPPAGTVLNAGTQTLSVTFTPTDTTNYNSVTTTTTITVGQAIPAVTWTTPMAIPYGTALGATQLNASSTVAGTFVYSPAAGTVLTVGTQTLSTILTPADTTTYTSATKTVVLLVNRAATTTTLAGNGSFIAPGQSITLTGVVVSTTGGTPTGTVIFYDGSTQLGVATLTNGQAGFTASALAPGVHALTAIYSGDGNFNGTTAGGSNGIMVTVTPLQFNISPTSGNTQTVIPGNSVNYSFSIAPFYGRFPGPVTFTVTGLPAGATYSFNPSSLPASSTGENVVLTIQTSKSSQTALLWRRSGTLSLALLLFPLLGDQRLRRAGNLRGRTCLLLLLITASLFSLSGCGTGAQAAKDYQVIVSVASGNLQQSASVTLHLE
jgi:sugar lactone lactonase YvrE